MLYTTYKKNLIVGIIVTFILLGTSFVTGIEINDYMVKNFNENEFIKPMLDVDTFYPTDDQGVQQTNPNHNYGPAMGFSIRNHGGSGWAFYSYIKFNLSSIPSDAVIISSKFWLYYYDYKDNNPSGNVINAYRATEDWDENTITWNNQPSVFSTASAGNTMPSAPGVWMNWTVTNDVSDFISGSQENYGWRLVDTTYWGGANIPISYFRSKEYGNYIPYLEVEYEFDVYHNLPPSVQINNPQNGESVKGMVSFTGTAYDPNGENDIEWVMLNIDGTGWVDVEGITNWNYVWDSTTVEDGRHYASAITYDGSNQSPVKNVEFYIDNIEDPEPPPKYPDLECNGMLQWSELKPKIVVTEKFTVQNVGDPETKLDWEITEYPDWGNWTFTPSEGYNLVPEYGEFTVNVLVVAPDETNQNFTGEIKIVNKENASDYDTIDVSLSTTKSKTVYSMLIQFLENHPRLFPILRYLLKL